VCGKGDTRYHPFPKTASETTAARSLAFFCFARQPNLISEKSPTEREGLAVSACLFQFFPTTLVAPAPSRRRLTRAHIHPSGGVSPLDQTTSRPHSLVFLTIPKTGYYCSILTQRNSFLLDLPLGVGGDRHRRKISNWWYVILHLRLVAVVHDSRIRRLVWIAKCLCVWRSFRLPALYSSSPSHSFATIYKLQLNLCCPVPMRAVRSPVRSRMWF
jgi:hypothetical protein